MLGYLWLLRHFALPDFPLPHASWLGTRAMVRENADGSIEQTYLAPYAVADDPVAHLVFALKYDGVHPQVLHAVFVALGPEALAAAIVSKPTSKYFRLLGFWYEWLMGERLPCEDATGGAYVPALPPENYVCLAEGDVQLVMAERVSRWRVVKNLLGFQDWFPIIRRTTKIRDGMARDDAPLLRRLRGHYSPELFQRASNYLYFKETRSSWQIEREEPSADRVERFVEALHQAGDTVLGERLSQAGLCAVQNQIVDARYAEHSFRSVQNFVGETRPDYSERVHYICPPPERVSDLMEGWADAAVLSLGLELHPVVHAATCAFGFVFIHPFEDGNGRLHRYLIHEILQSHAWGLEEMLLPLSATILRRLSAYDAVLETYSKPILRLAKIEFDANNKLKVLNSEVLMSSWRWPDLTRQVEFMFDTIAHCLREDLPQELAYLQGYDRTRLALREVVDMPDRRLNLLLRLMHQNEGRLGKGKRSLFAELSDDELQRMESAYAEAMASVTIPSLDEDS